MDMEGSTQFFHIQIFKVFSMVYKDGSWDVEAKDYMVEDKFRDLNSHSYNKGYYFNPLSKIVYGYDDPFVNF